MQWPGPRQTGPSRFSGAVIQDPGLPFFFRIPVSLSRTRADSKAYTAVLVSPALSRQTWPAVNCSAGTASEPGLKLAHYISVAAVPTYQNGT